MIAGRVLVTGASGFLGRHLVSRLRSAGAEVHTVGRQPSSEVAPAECRWTADVADERQAREVVQTVKPDVVVHLGALTHAAPDLDLETGLRRTVDWYRTHMNRLGRHGVAP